MLHPHRTGTFQLEDSEAKLYRVCTCNKSKAIPQVTIHEAFPPTRSQLWQRNGWPNLRSAIRVSASGSSRMVTWISRRLADPARSTTTSQKSSIASFGRADKLQEISRDRCFRHCKCLETRAHGVRLNSNRINQSVPQEPGQNRTEQIPSLQLLPHRNVRT